MKAIATVTINGKIADTFECSVDEYSGRLLVEFPRDITCEEGDQITFSYTWRMP